MSEYSKKLHYRKNGAVTDISLYTNIGEAGSNHIMLRDGSVNLYAGLTTQGNPYATDLTIRKNGSIYRVAKSVKQTTTLSFNYHADDYAWAYIGQTSDCVGATLLGQMYYKDGEQKITYELNNNIQTYYLLFRANNTGGPYDFYANSVLLHDSTFKFESSNSQSLDCIPSNWVANNSGWSNYTTPVVHGSWSNTTSGNGLWANPYSSNSYFMTKIVRTY